MPKVINPINWRERLAEVEGGKRKLFAARDYDRACSWMTCAVGEWHQKLPEIVVYEKDLLCDRVTLIPVDEELAELGDELPIAILNNDFELVHKLLDQIDDRVMELKREQT